MQLLDLQVPETPTRLAALEQAAAARRPADGEMLVDGQTLRDLEIFESSGGAPSLYELLNRTRTVGGDRVLRARFRRPLATPGAIRAVHGALEDISKHRDIFRTLPSEAMIAGVRQYLQSNLPMLGTRNQVLALFEALELRITELRATRQLLGGVRRTVLVLRWLSHFAFRAELQETQGELAPRLAEIRSLLEEGQLRDIPFGRFGWLRMLRLDRRFRGDERAALERLLELMYEIDALVSMTDATRELGFAMPEVLDEPGRVVAEGIYHPFLPEAVRNPLYLDQRQRLLFLTGPNMAGKTTYLRACGIAVYLAHVGMGVPARAMSCSTFDNLFSAITLTDNVREGVSFFRAEALRAKSIAQALADGRRVFALLDEPFKGTNVKDALDASGAIFARFAEEEGSVFLVSSHLIELGEPLLATGAVDCRRFEAAEEGGELQYDFVLKPGISDQRLGVRVLEEEGVFALLGPRRRQEERS